MHDQQGLSSEEAFLRLQKYGPNAIEEKHELLIIKFAKYFWGPIPWMIEIAAILSAILRHWSDFYVILILLVINSFVGFWEEFQAGNAIAALKRKLALKSIVKRDGKWIEIDAKDLVPGDLVLLKLGNIIPADVTLIEGEFLTIDQSTLTGESLPVTKKIHDTAYAGSVAKQGEMTALVTATGKNSYFGKTAKLVESAHPSSHFQKAVLLIGRYLIYISLALAILLTIIQLIRGDSVFKLAQFVLILIVASIPVAMPAVLSITMALGALRLSKMKAVVTRLESIEEMAGVDILCCDKTGTLTQNKLSLGKPIVYNNIEEQNVVLHAVLASKEEDQDPIDLAIIQGFKNPDILKNFTQVKFVPFDPVSKKTEAQIRDMKSKTFYVSKGAPQVILALCHLESSQEMSATINALSKKGFRTLGVARSIDKKTWEFLGFLPLFDPLREDSVQTIKEAQEHGIQIKMLTGDNIAIACEIAKELHLGEKICVAEKNLSLDDIEKSNGFAQIFPEHKYDIVKALQNKGHIVGMTGDGVNDSPALKQADVGIAVSGATDAARSAASLVLLESGLSIITKAIDEARRIFERMNSYSIYRITETLRIMLFMVSSILIFNFYPVTAIMIIVLALLNDIPIMAIVYDHTPFDIKPVRWQMRRVLSIATILGFVGIIETFLLLIIAKYGLHLDLQEIQSFIFLKLSVAGHQTLFIARTRGPFFSKPYPSPILLTSILTTQVFAALLVGFGWFVAPISWSLIGLIWLYTLVWMFIEDGVKLLSYRYLANSKE